MILTGTLKKLGGPIAALVLDDPFFQHLKFFNTCYIHLYRS